MTAKVESKEKSYMFKQEVLDFLLDYNRNLIGHSYRSNNKRKNAKKKIVHLKYKNEDYVPFFAIDVLSEYADASHLDALKRSFSSEVGKEEMRIISKCKNNKIKAFVRKAVKTNNIGLIFLILTEKLYLCTSIKNLKEKLLEVWDKNINEDKLDTSLYVPETTDKTSSAGLVEFSRFSTSWFAGFIRSTKVENRHYVATRYFLAQVERFDGNTPYHYWSGLPGGPMGYKVLYCLMVKKNFLPYVKACMLSNTPINPSVLELWVDKSLDNVKGGHPPRAGFIKFIRKPLLEAGVEMKVFDSLYDEMYEGMKPPAFKDLKERKEWIAKVFKVGLDNMKQEVISNIGAEGEPVESEELDW